MAQWSLSVPSQSLGRNVAPGERARLNQHMSAVLSSLVGLPAVGCVPACVWRSESGGDLTSNAVTPECSQRMEGTRRRCMYMFVRHMWREGKTALVKSHYVSCHLQAIVLITLPVACTPTFKHELLGQGSESEALSK